MDRSDKPDDGIAALLSKVIAGLGRLAQGEMRLAKAEAQVGVRAMASGVIKLILAVILALVGLNVLAGALVAALVAAGLEPGWAGLAVGLVLLLLAVALGAAGRAGLRPNGLWPKRAFHAVCEDAGAVFAAFRDEGPRND